jgi:hypothetical protein
MVILSEVAINELIAERKPMPDGLQPITRWVERNRHFRREYEIKSNAGNNFMIKLRKSAINPFDFSAILGYQLPGVNTIFHLRRYNGTHYHSNTIENVRFRACHIHTATERYQTLGGKVEHFAEVTTRYADLDSAIKCMLEDCGFRDSIEESPVFKGTLIE